MAKSFDVLVSEAVDLLPPKGEWVEFDAYKSNLYSKQPESGNAVFAHMIKRDVVLKKLDTNTSGKVVVFLSRVN
jgi:hypothetical protein